MQSKGRVPRVGHSGPRRHTSAGNGGESAGRGAGGRVQRQVLVQSVCAFGVPAAQFSRRLTAKVCAAVSLRARKCRPSHDSTHVSLRQPKFLNLAKPFP